MQGENGMKNKTILACLLLSMAACATPATEEYTVPSLMEADRAFFQTLADADAFLAYLAPDVYFLPPDGPRLQGPEAFRASMEQLLQMPGAQLTWSPDVAETSAGGDMGYTIGSFQLTLDGPDGEPSTRTGKYVTLWERRDGGRWTVVGDTFNFDAPVPET